MNCRDRVFDAVIAIVAKQQLPATCRDVQQRCEVAPITARRALERLRADGLLWRVPAIYPEQETGRYGYLPVDDALVGNLRLGECDVDGCIAVPQIVLRRGRRQWKLCRTCMRGFDERRARGFAGATDERRFSRGLVAGRTNSVGSCGGWDPDRDRG